MGRTWRRQAAMLLRAQYDEAGASPRHLRRPAPFRRLRPEWPRLAHHRTDEQRGCGPTLPVRREQWCRCLALRCATLGFWPRLPPGTSADGCALHDTTPTARPACGSLSSGSFSHSVCFVSVCVCVCARALPLLMMLFQKPTLRMLARFRGSIWKLSRRPMNE